MNKDILDFCSSFSAEDNSTKVYSKFVLKNSGRTFFITKAEKINNIFIINGYESGCPYSAERWFSVPVDFFDSVEEANKDTIVVEQFPVPILLKDIGDNSI
jgi:hypothetical protein